MQETWVQSSGSGRSPGEGNGNLLQYSCLENPMDRGAWRATVHGVTKSWTRLTDKYFHFQYYNNKYYYSMITNYEIAIVKNNNVYKKEERKKYKVTVATWSI